MADDGFIFNLIPDPNGVANIRKAVQDGLKDVTLTLSPSSLNNISNDLKSKLSKNFTIDINKGNLDEVTKILEKQGSAAGKASQSLKEHAKAILGASEATFAFSERVKISTQRLAAYYLPATAFLQFRKAVAEAAAQIQEIDKDVIRLTQDLDGNARAANDLADKVLSIGTKYSQSGAEILKVTDLLEKSKNKFTSQDQIVRTIEALSKAKLASNFTDMGKAAEGLISALNVFNLNAEESVSIFDAIDKLSHNFSVNSADLFEAFEHGASSFKAAGGNAKEFLAIVTALKQTTQSSVSGITENFNQAFSHFNSSDSISYAQRLTGNQMRDANGNLKSLTDRLVEIGKVTKNYSDEQLAPLLEKLAGTRDIKLFAPLLRDLKDPATSQTLKALSQIGQSSGSTDKNSQVALQSLENQLNSITARFSEVFHDLSQDQGIRDLISQFATLAKSVADVLDFAKPLLPILLKLSTIRLALFGIQSGGFGLGPALLKGVFGGGVRSATTTTSQTVGSDLNFPLILGKVNQKIDQDTNIEKNLNNRLLSVSSSKLPSRQIDVQQVVTSPSQKSIETIPLAIEGQKKIVLDSLFIQRSRENLSQDFKKQLNISAFNNPINIAKTNADALNIADPNSRFSQATKSLEFRGIENEGIQSTSTDIRQKFNILPQFENKKIPSTGPFVPSFKLKEDNSLLPFFGSGDGKPLLSSQQQIAAKITQMETILQEQNEVLATNVKFLRDAGLTDQQINEALKLELLNYNEGNAELAKMNEQRKIQTNLSSLSGSASTGKGRNATNGLIQNLADEKILQESVERLSIEQNKLAEEMAISGLYTKENNTTIGLYTKAIQEDVVSLEQLQVERKLLQKAYVAEIDATVETALAKSSGAGLGLGNKFSKFASSSLPFALTLGASFAAGSIADSQRKSGNIVGANTAQGAATGFGLGSLALILGGPIGVTIAALSGLIGSIKGYFDGKKEVEINKTSGRLTSAAESVDFVGTGRQLEFKNQEDLASQLSTAGGQSLTGKLKQFELDFFKNNAQNFKKSGNDLGFDLSGAAQKQVLDQLQKGFEIKGFGKDEAAAKASTTLGALQLDLEKNGFKILDVAEDVGRGVIEQAKKSEEAFDKVKHALTLFNDSLTLVADRIHDNTRDINTGILNKQFQTQNINQAFGLSFGKTNDLKLPSSFSNTISENLQSALRKTDLEGVQGIVDKFTGNTLSGKEKSEVGDAARIEKFLKSLDTQVIGGLAGKGFNPTNATDVQKGIGEFVNNILTNNPNIGIQTDAGKSELIDIAEKLKDAALKSPESFIKNPGDFAAGFLQQFADGKIILERFLAVQGKIDAELERSLAIYEGVREAQQKLIDATTQGINTRIQQSRLPVIGATPTQTIGALTNLSDNLGFNASDLSTAAGNVSSAQKDRDKAFTARQLNPQDATANKNFVDAQTNLLDKQQKYTTALTRSNQAIEIFRARMEETSKRLGELFQTQKTIGQASFGQVQTARLGLKFTQSAIAPIQDTLNANNVTNVSQLGNLSSDQLKQLVQSASRFAGLQGLNEQEGSARLFGGLTNPNGKNGQTINESLDIFDVLKGISLSGGDFKTQLDEQIKLLGLQKSDFEKTRDIENDQLKALDTINSTILESTNNILQALGKPPIPINQVNAATTGQNTTIPIPQLQRSPTVFIDPQNAERGLDTNGVPLNIGSRIKGQRNEFHQESTLNSTSANLAAIANELKTLKGLNQSNPAVQELEKVLQNILAKTKSSDSTIKVDSNINVTGFDTAGKDTVIKVVVSNIMQEFIKHLDTSDPAQAQLAQNMNLAIKSILGKKDGN